MMEIERKWLISGFPKDMEPDLCAEFEVWYLCDEPEIRIRRRGRSYRMCVKSKGTLSRKEIESDVPEDFAEGLIDFIGKEPVIKQMQIYCLPDGNRLECSCVDPGRDTCFMYAEIEFESEEKALAYKPIALLENEVTYNADYRMSAYWRRTRIEK